MKKVLKTLLAVLILLTISFAFGYCIGRLQTPKTCTIDGKTFAFASAKTRRSWRADLVGTLTDLLEQERSGGEMNDLSLYGVRECGLLDADLDGTPELVVLTGGYGGSSGMMTYRIYKLSTHGWIGEMDDGMNGNWRVCYDVKAGRLRTFGEYTWRMGAMKQMRTLSEIVYSADHSGYVSEVHLYTEYDTAPDNDLKYDADYQIDGRHCTADEYYDEYRVFTDTCVLIPETELVMVDWSRADTPEDVSRCAEVIADRLLASGQQFIVKN